MSFLQVTKGNRVIIETENPETKEDTMSWRDKWEGFKENILHKGKHEEGHRHTWETKVEDPHRPDEVAGSEFFNEVKDKKSNAPESSEEERR